MKKLIFIACLTLIISPATSIQAQINLFDSLQLFYALDGNSGDSSGNGYHGTSYGSINSTSDRFGNPNSALDFDGSNDWIDTETTFDYEFRTVSFWFNSDNNTGTRVLLTQDSNGFNYGAFHAATTNDNLVARAGGAPTQTIQNNIGTGNWHHVSLIRTDLLSYYYLNGQLMTTSSPNSSGSSTSPNEKLVIGVHRNESTGHFNGKIDDLRIYNRALTPQEIMSLYCPTAPVISLNDTTIDVNSTLTFANTAFEIDTMAWYINGTYINSDSSFVHLFDSAGVYEIVAYGSDGFCAEYDTIQIAVNPANCLPQNALQDELKLHYVLSGNANDLSPSGYHATIHGATLTTDRFGNANSAYNFDGSNDYIEYENPDTNLDYQFRTIAAWFNADNLAGTQRIFDMDHIDFVFGSTGATITGSQLRGNGGGDGGAVFQNGITANQWHHVAVQRDASNTYGYVNGQLVYTGTASSAGSTIASGANFDFILGAARNYTDHFDGKIDDVRVYNRVLNADEIATLYCPALAKIQENNAIIGIGESLSFHSDCNIYSTSWYVNNNFISNDSTFTHLFNQAGTDTIVLSATDGFCTNYDTIFVTVEPANCLTSGSTTDSLLLYMPMAGSTFNAGTLNATITLDGATPTADRFGNPNSAYNFDGNDHIEVEHNFDYNYKTFSFWFRATNTSGSGNNAKFIFSHDNDNNSFGSSGAWYNNGQLRLMASSGPAEVISNDAPINTWHHIAVIRDNSETRYYLNGAHVLTGIATSGGSSTYANPFLVIGAGRATTNQFFQGQIDEARVYNRALTSEEVKTLYCPSQAIINQNDTVVYAPTVLNLEAECTEYPLSWVLNGDTVSTDSVYALNVPSIGLYELILSSTDGFCVSMDTVRVIFPPDSTCLGTDTVIKVSSTEGNFNGVLDNGDYFGYGLATYPDINNDGIDEILVGAFRDDDGGTDRGAMYVISMNNQGVIYEHYKISSDSGNFGVGLANGDAFGTSIDVAGDINGDGIPDIVVGANDTDDGGTNRGAVWVLFMDTNGLVDSKQKISDTQGGLQEALSNTDRFGTEVSAIGDLNGDGVPDIACGMPADNNGASTDGSVLLLFLNSNGTVSDEVKLTKSTPGLSNLLNDGDRLGQAVELLGDLDGDGVQEIALGAGGYDAGGNDRGAVIIASIDSTGAVVNASRITENENGFNEQLDNLGNFSSALANLGDVDGDGFLELAVGNWRDNTGGSESGAVWVLSLDDYGYVFNTVKIDNNHPSLNLDADDRFGRGISAIGDFNNDGVTDLAVGARQDDDGGTDRGAFYLFSIIDTCCPLIAGFSSSATETCLNGNITFTNTTLYANAGATYEWFINDVLISTSVNFNHTFTSQGDQFVELVVTDSCTRSYTEVITVHQNPIADAGSSQFICLGDTVQLNASGGVNYQWSNGATLSNDTIANPLAFPTSSAIYFLTVTDINGCTDTDDMALIVNTPPTVGVSGDTLICPGNAASLTATGANTYNWSPATSLNTASGFSVTATPVVSTTYVVTGTDINGCTDTASITVNIDTSLVASIASASDASCFGGNDGSAIGASSGGNPPYSYAWSSGSSSINANNLSSGQYIFSVSDNSGCLDTASVFINQPDSIQIGAIITDALCAGNANGSIDASASGGTPGYTYAWSNSVGTASNPNIAAGTYTVTVTDNNSCTNAASFIVNEPSPLDVVISDSADVLCFGGNSGSAEASASGGTAPYSYAWSNGSNTPISANLSAGIYSVTVTDFNGCTDTAQVAIAQPANALSAGIASITNVVCNGDNTGSVTANASGGTGSYQYAWSNSANTASISNLAAGNYTVTITDDNGCQATTIASVTEPLALTVSFSIDSNVSCQGGSDGATTAIPAGGVAPYTFNWAAGSTTATQGNLYAGSHLITVTDNNACAVVASVSITEPDLLVASSTVDADVLCYGNATGIASASATGGTSPYNYAWSSGGNNATEPGLMAGNYTVTITDDKGCEDTSIVNISQPDSLVASIDSAFDALCNANASGHAYASASGGVAPYSFAWSSGGFSSSATNLLAGTYTVTITDGNSCTAAVQVTIGEPTPLTLTAAEDSAVLCNGDSNGVATANAAGGTAPYTYIWENGENNATATALWAGIRTVSVTDANGCIQSANVSINQPTPVVVTLDSTKDVICNGFYDGAAYTSASGGVGTHTFAWNSGDLIDDIDSLTSGIYVVSVTDTNGCMDTTSVIIVELDPILPNISHIDVTCFDGNDGSAASAVSGGGTSFDYLWSTNAITTGLNNLSSGVYTLTITDENNCSGVDSAVVLQPDSIQLSLTIANITCFGAMDGSASFTVSGGTAPHTFVWSNGATDTLDTGLDEGMYYVSITDNFACTNVDSFYIAEPSTITGSITLIDSVTCFGDADGSAYASANGGVGNYSFAWSNGSTSDTLQNVLAGLYTVTMSDSNGCAFIDQITIEQPDLLQVTLDSLLDAQCYESADGVLVVGFSGGNDTVSYLWSNNVASPYINNLATGNYTVTITDTKGCQDSSTFFIDQPDTSVHVSGAVIVDAYCNGGEVGSISINADGGTSPYTYAWNSGQTSNDPQGLGAGTYTLTITDAQGCMHDSSFVVNEPNMPDTALTAATDITCFGDSNGFIQAQFVGGIAPYFYSWSNNTYEQIADSLAPGVYTVTIFDSVGCTQIAIDSISEPSELLIQTTQIDSILCFGDSTGLVYAQYGGGTAPLQLVWNTGAMTDTISTLPSAAYTALLMDANGCSDSSEIFVSQPEKLIIDSTQLSHVSCNGFNDGAIEVFYDGGSNPINFSWNTGDTTALITQIIAGVYSVTLNDANGCVIDSTIQITEPDSLLAAINLIDSVGCQNVQDGAISASAFGGTAPYQIIWNTASTSDTLLNVATGQYAVTITDALGCIDSVERLLPFKYEAPVAGLQSDTLFCNQTQATLFANTGYQSYAWSTGSVQYATNVNAVGTYTVTITSTEGCVSIDSTTVEFGQSTPFSLGNDTIVCMDGNDQTSLTLAAAPPGFQAYLWNTGDTTNTITVTTTGTYSLEAFNQEGCAYTDAIIVVFDTCRNVNVDETIAKSPEFHVFPIPTRDKLHVKWMQAPDHEVELILRSAQGELVEKLRTSLQETEFDLTNYAAGVYVLSITAPDFHSQVRVIKQ